MSMINAMNDLINFRADMNNQSRETVNSTIAAWRSVARSQPLKREQFALNAMLDTLIHAMNTSDLTLAYEYKGKLYAVHKDYRIEPRGGVFSTDYLHALGLTMDEWDKMPKFNVWVNTGKVYAPCL